MEDNSSKVPKLSFFCLTLINAQIVIIDAGTIDSTALDGLYLATELTEHIRVKSDTNEETGEEFSKFFPTLIWAVRDHVRSKDN